MAKRIPLLFVLMLVASTVWAQFKILYDFSAVSGTNTLYYKITDADAKTVAVVAPQENSREEPSWYDHTQPKGTLIIPTTVRNGGTTYTVTSISEKAFAYCRSLRGTLTIPSTVTSIKKHAFESCRFTGTLIIPDNVKSIERGGVKFNEELACCMVQASACT